LKGKKARRAKVEWSSAKATSALHCSVQNEKTKTQEKLRGLFQQCDKKLNKTL
jgi:hypothetical protein